MSEAFISPKQIPTMTEQHRDDRRTISEVLIEDGHEGHRVTLLEIGDSGGILGNHFHLNHDEHFRLFMGKAILLLANPEDLSNVEQQEFNAPAEITIPKGTTHTFVLESSAQMVSVMDGEFDPEDMHSSTLA
jgi:dTDP-4-dehydrorhamnose 3,5-epimerase-like enzyme